MTDTESDAPSHPHHYLLSAVCPDCGEQTEFVETFDSAVSLDMDIPPSAEFCPRCGTNVNEHEYSWDVHEETEVERVAPSQERRDGCELFREVREFLEQQPMTGADWPDLLDHVNHLEENGYRGELYLEPDMRQEDVVFRLGLAAGYACGIRDGDSDGE